MRIENHVVGEIFAQRLCGNDPRYALLISHGIGAHSGIYNVFMETHAAKGVDVWAYDAPGHGRSTSTLPRGRFAMSEWIEASLSYAAYIKGKTGLPVIALGSSLGSGAAFSSLHSNFIDGAILMGSTAVPCAKGGLLAPDNFLRDPAFDQMESTFGPSMRFDIDRFIDFDEDYGLKGAGEQKRLDPYNIWMYDFASWRSIFTYTPTVLPEDNRKPILVAVGERDPLSPPAAMQAVADSIGGPVRFEVLGGAGHQLMLFDTQRFSDLVDEWVLSNVTA